MRFVFPIRISTSRFEMGYRTVTSARRMFNQPFVRTPYAELTLPVKQTFFISGTTSPGARSESTRGRLPTLTASTADWRHLRHRQLAINYLFRYELERQAALPASAIFLCTPIAAPPLPADQRFHRNRSRFHRDSKSSGWASLLIDAAAILHIEMAFRSCHLR